MYILEKRPQCKPKLIFVDSKMLGDLYGEIGMKLLPLTLGRGYYVLHQPIDIDVEEFNILVCAEGEEIQIFGACYFVKAGKNKLIEMESASQIADFILQSS